MSLKSKYIYIISHEVFPHGFFEYSSQSINKNNKFAGIYLNLWKLLNMISNILTIINFFIFTKKALKGEENEI